MSETNKDKWGPAPSKEEVLKEALKYLEESRCAFALFVSAFQRALKEYETDIRSLAEKSPRD